MTLEALQHLLRSSRTLAEDRELIVLGSASLLVHFPELGRGESPLASTYDADLLPIPFDELTGLMLQQALGEAGAFHTRHGYHADVLRDSVRSTLPEGWLSRTVEVPGATYARALDPADLVAVKLWVGRPKYIALASMLAASGRVTKDAVSERIRLLPVAPSSLPRILAHWRQVSPHL